MSSTFTPEDVRRLARLARIELTTEEISIFAEQLSGILAFAAEVQAVATADVDPGMNGAAEPASLRDDVVVPALARSEALEEASQADLSAGFFTVPRVFAE